jgi:ABC-type transport system involved in cytochrome c biogenesis permease subunit
MNWLFFPFFAAITALLLIAGNILFYSKKEVPGRFFTITGILTFSLFIALLWISLQRPPLRTLGETRLWYALFLPVIGYLTYERWKYKWFMAYSNAMAILFMLLNVLKTEAHDKVLAPALQSPWFVPHVVVYIFGYALLAASALVGLKGLYLLYFKKSDETPIKLADNMVYAGFAFITCGLLFGALWAKTAWGHYWTWDPKETWAFLTWLSYLIYIHLRFHRPIKKAMALWMLSLAFVVLLIAWFGLNYLPSAQNSVHVYSNR